MTKGRCPFAVWRGDDGMGGYPAGTPDQNRPLIFVDHIMAGWKSTLDGQWRINAGVDVTFGIGRDGSLSQYTNVFDAHWGNGVTGARNVADRRGIDRYDRSNRHLKAIEDGGRWVYTSGVWWLAKKRRAWVSALNAASISTEQEGLPFDRAGFDATWPEAMIQMNIRTKRWAMEEFARYGYQMPPVDDDLLVGHFQIDTINRPNCPGPEWPKARILNALRQDISTPPKGDDMPTIEEIRQVIQDETDSKRVVVRAKGLPNVFVYDPSSGRLVHDVNPTIFHGQGSTGAEVILLDESNPDHAKILALPALFPGGLKDAIAMIKNYKPEL